MMAKKQATTSPGGLKGFGGRPKIKGDFNVINDPACDRLCRWLLDGGASIGKVMIADFGGMRGVAAAQPIDKGEAVVAIPVALALPLGSEGSNPGYAACRLLDACRAARRAPGHPHQPLLDVLPPPAQCDSADFYSGAELAALEWAPAAEETRERLALLRGTADAANAAAAARAGFGGGGGGAGELYPWEDVLWATYQVVSRALSIYDKVEGGTKHLIPMVDLFNHDPLSPHTLRCTGGMYQVVAGRRIKAGEQVHIVYGAGVLNNDRLLQDYGFFESANPNDLKQLSLPAGPEYLPGLPFRGLGMDAAGARAALAGFSTTLEEDEALLRGEGDLGSRFMRTAIAFRAEKKRDLLRLIARLEA